MLLGTIHYRDPANKMDKLKNYQVLTQQKPNKDMKSIFTEEECHGSAIGSLLWKMWIICYNQYLVDINRRFPNPILHSETSIVSQGDTIPEEDRIYDKDTSNS